MKWGLLEIIWAQLGPIGMSRTERKMGMTLPGLLGSKFRLFWNVGNFTQTEHFDQVGTSEDRELAHSSHSVWPRLA